MSSTRPHVDRTLEQLRTLFDDAGDDKARLRELMAELEIRAAAATETLVFLGQVRERLEATGRTRQDDSGANGETTLPDLILADHGIRAAATIARFRSPGWFSVGSTSAGCPVCGRKGLEGYRKPYLTKTGGQYFYWALLCPSCQQIFEPAELNPTSRAALSKESRHRPGPKDNLGQTSSGDAPQTLPESNTLDGSATSPRQVIECEGCLNELEIPELHGPTKLTCPICDIEFEAAKSLDGQLKSSFRHGGEIVCLDFGTSSLRAALQAGNNAAPVALEIGEVVRSSIDRASIPSAIFIPDSGKEILFGEEALERGLRGDPCLLFETSPKRWMNDGDAGALEYAPLRGIPISRKSLLVGLAAQGLRAAAEASGMKPERLRSIDVRVAHPVWNDDRGEGLRTSLGEILSAAVDVLTEVGSSISVEDLERLCEEDPGRIRGPRIDVVEPIAAGIDLFANAENSREVCAVVDVGAGTIDLGLFFSLTPDEDARGHQRSFISIATPRSIYMAGDVIDEELTALIKERAGQDLSNLAVADIERRKRKIKEHLFDTGSILEAGTTIRREELGNRPRIQEMTRTLNSAFRSMIMEAAPQIVGWCSVHSHRVEWIDVVFAGGGARIDFLHDALDGQISLRPSMSIPVRIRRPMANPGILPASPERLAVALGGTTPEERWPRTEMQKPSIHKVYRL